ncbi:hypothetical protein PRRU23_28130 [Segatella bryantii]|uniref:Uncharacterized protein n=1 Tax=Segatella bryantii TaxID=77095 RepID=A0AA37I0E4_SEGBR|nr:hypothetical protein PRRU23_28130 [Segatella bryantii]
MLYYKDSIAHAREQAFIFAHVFTRLYVYMFTYGRVNVVTNIKNINSYVAENYYIGELQGWDRKEYFDRLDWSMFSHERLQGPVG